MTPDEAIALVLGGSGRINSFGEWLEARARAPSLRKVDLSEAPLSGARLNGVDLSGANLAGADLCSARLVYTDLSGADLSYANLSNANLSHANLTGTNLLGANLWRANLGSAKLAGGSLASANLDGADLSDANLSTANLTEADLIGAELTRTNLSGANLSGTNLSGARLRGTILADLDLCSPKGLDEVKHLGPSYVTTSTLQKSRGRIGAAFLRGCGLSPLEAELVTFYDSSVSAVDLTELFTVKLLPMACGGPIAIGGVFISYSQRDAEFANRLREDLYAAGASVWLDRHDLQAGDLQKQIQRAIRMQDVVLLILSKDSITSDWVEHELEMARQKEKAEGRDVLCPIALDDSWKQKVAADVLWRQLSKKNVLDFSGWRTPSYARQLTKLCEGIRQNYRGPAPR